MKKILYIIIPLFILAVMEGAAWMVIKSSEEEVVAVTKTEDQKIKEPQPETASVKEEIKEETEQKPLSVSETSTSSSSSLDDTDSESFPPPSTEIKNGKTERTIHIGVRRYVWEPKMITAKKGELVRLIVHNADVKHGLVIPDLGVNQDISPDGAVVEFIASQTGTFEFFCSVYCGEGHMEMRGKIVIE